MQALTLIGQIAFEISQTNGFPIVFKSKGRIIYAEWLATSNPY